MEGYFELKNELEEETYSRDQLKRSVDSHGYRCAKIARTEDEQDGVFKLDYFMHLECDKEDNNAEDLAMEVYRLENMVQDQSKHDQVENHSTQYDLDFNYVVESPESFMEDDVTLYMNDQASSPALNSMDNNSIAEASTLAQAGSDSEATSNNATENARTWSYSEEVHFVGAVFMALTEKGSLFPNARKNVKNGKSIRQGESDTWSTVQEYFKQLKADSNQKFRERSPTALCRHFKHMKSRLEKRDSSCMEYLGRWLRTSGCSLLGKTIQLPIEVKWNPSRLGNWTPIEEIALVGASVQRFMQRGSLCNKDGKWCWDEVKAIYDASFEHLNYKNIGERDGEMLQHHFKVLKKRLAREGKTGQLNAGSECTRYRFRSYFWAYVMLMEGEDICKIVKEL